MRGRADGVCSLSDMSVARSEIERKEWIRLVADRLLIPIAA
jgi:hypothetical protein